jgi:hypothetical protein
MSVTIPILTFFSGAAVAAGSFELPLDEVSSSPHAATTVPMHSVIAAMSSSRMNFEFTESIPRFA